MNDFMLDIGNPINKTYFDIISNIDYQGSKLRVYRAGSVPAVVTYPYVVIASRTGSDAPDKDSFGYDATQAVHVIDRYPANNGTETKINDISTLIIGAIRRIKNRIDIGERFNVITSTLDNTITITQQTDTYQYYTHEIRFRHVIEQLAEVPSGALLFEGQTIQFEGQTLTFAQ